VLVDDMLKSRAAFLPVICDHNAGVPVVEHVGFTYWVYLSQLVFAKLCTQKNLTRHIHGHRVCPRIKRLDDARVHEFSFGCSVLRFIAIILSLILSWRTGAARLLPFFQYFDIGLVVGKCELGNRRSYPAFASAIKPCLNCSCHDSSLFSCWLAC